VAIEVLDEHMHLLVSTSEQPDTFDQPGVEGLGVSPAPWDEQAARRVMQKHAASPEQPDMSYSMITYEGQRVRVYSLLNNFCGESVHIIQTARSEQDIEQSLDELRMVLLRGGALVLGFAVVGGWFMTWGVLTAVRQMTRTAQSISSSHNFRQRVPDKGLWRVRDELATLATTFKVSDTGMGIAAEDVPHIFERFYRADRVRSREQGGSGLGLAIVESIVREHGGSVEVKSRQAEGSVFRVRLPGL
jgi:two-component system, OmpR family, sensor kinase